MEYNSRLVNNFNEEIYTKLLASPIKYQDLIKKRLYRYQDSTSNLEDMMLIDAFEGYLFRTMLDNPYKLDAHDMIYFRDILYQMFLKDKNIAMDSLMFDERVVNILFTSEQKNEINNYKNKTVNNVRDNAKKFINGEYINDIELDEVLRFSINQINNEHLKNYHDNLYRKLIENVYERKTNLQYEYIMKYTAYLASKDLDIENTSVYLVNKSSENVEFPKNTGGRSYGNSGVVALNLNLINEVKEKKENSSFIEQPTLINYLHVIAHEVRHSKQAMDVDKKIISIEAFEYIKRTLFSKYLSSEMLDEYKRNYSFSEIEMDAEKYGWTFATKILEKYNKNAYQEIKASTSMSILHFYKSSMAVKATEDNQDLRERKSADVYNTVYLDQIIKTNPQELNNYPMLKEIYNNDGTRKDFIELLNKEEKLSQSVWHKTITHILKDFYMTDIRHGYLNTLNVNSLDLETQFKLFDKIMDMLIEEIEFMKRSINILYKDSLGAFEVANKDRAKKIKYLLEYLKINQELIDKLISIDISEGNKRGFGMQYNYVDTFYNSLIRKIDDKDYLKDTSIYEDLISIRSVGYGR